MFWNPKQVFLGISSEYSEEIPTDTLPSVGISSAYIFILPGKYFAKIEIIIPTEFRRIISVGP